MIKLSDFVCNYIEKIGISTVFTLTGGGIMHLVDSVGNSNLEYICCHHEQACSIAAQAYDMYKNNLSVCLITTGPGGTNAITGAAAAYVDSTPMLFITGQVKRDDFASRRNVRQFGAQENDIISMVKPITKYAVLITNPEDILYCLQKAVFLAMHGRRGPVWLDIPLDVQSAIIDEDNLREFNPGNERLSVQVEDDKSQEQTDCISLSLKMISEAKRPLILVGHGAIASGAEEELCKLQEKLGIPVMSTWRALSLYDTENELFFGSPGLQAPRYSNMILQGCDLLIVLGTRLDNMITAFSENHFAFRAKKIIVDIDENEIKKLDMPDVFPVISDVKNFLRLLNEHTESFVMADFKNWITFCRNLKKRFPILQERQVAPEGVNLYQVTNKISEYCRAEDCIVISSTSRCNTAGHIAFQHKKGQTTISSMGMGSMGFAIPSAVGAFYANGKNRVIVIEGDGSLQLNIQELQTIKHYGVKAKMFIFNNNGYAAITTMQERNFDAHFVGSNPESGVTMPDLEKIAYAYGFDYIRIDNEEQINQGIKNAMAGENAVICDIIGSLKFDEIPKCISSVNEQGQRVSASLENPYPFLTEKEMNEIYSHIITEEK